NQGTNEVHEHGFHDGEHDTSFLQTMRAEGYSVRGWRDANGVHAQMMGRREAKQRERWADRDAARDTARVVAETRYGRYLDEEPRVVSVLRENWEEFDAARASAGRAHRAGDSAALDRKSTR